MKKLKNALAAALVALAACNFGTNGLGSGSTGTNGTGGGQETSSSSSSASSSVGEGGATNTTGVGGGTGGQGGAGGSLPYCDTITVPSNADGGEVTELFVACRADAIDPNDPQQVYFYEPNINVVAPHVVDADCDGVVNPIEADPSTVQMGAKAAAASVGNVLPVNTEVARFIADPSNSNQWTLDTAPAGTPGSPFPNGVSTKISNNNQVAIKVQAATADKPCEFNSF